MGNKQIIISAFIICAFVFSINAQIPIPAKIQSGAIIILNATAHLGNGKVIENSAIAFENGKITLVADAKTVKLDLAHYKEVIKAEGKHIYPGLIAANSTLGLVEIEAVLASVDDRETGEFLPNVRSVIAYNTDSRVIPTVRSNGVLLAQIVPKGGIISGTSSVVQFDAWNWEDAMVKENDGIFMNWPQSFYRTGWWAEPGQLQNNEEGNETFKKINDFFEEAQAYCKAEQHKEMDLRMEAMKGIFSGTSTLFVRVNLAKDILSVIEFKKKFGINKLVLVGAAECAKVTDEIKKENIAIILYRSHELPIHSDEDIFQPFKTPAQLDEKGILYCISAEGDMEPMNTRNLSYYAGTSVAYGLDYEKAISSITYNAAKILGIDQSYGTIEQGKSATFIISSGDILDMRFSIVEYGFIDGRKLDLNNHQKELMEKFSER